MGMNLKMLGAPSKSFFFFLCLLKTNLYFFLIEKKPDLVPCFHVFNSLIAQAKYF